MFIKSHPDTSSSLRKSNRIRLVVILFYGGMAVFAWGWNYLAGLGNVFLYDSEPFSGKLFIRNISSIFYGVSLGVILVWISSILQKRYRSIQLLYNELHHLLSPLQKKDLIILALFSSLGEEFLFRAVLLKQFAKWLTPDWLGLGLAILISSFLFSLLHIAPRGRFISWTFFSFGVGVIFSLLYIVLGDLLGPIAVHFTVNWMNLGYIVHMPKRAALYE